jgi:hypothetical protein
VTSSVRGDFSIVIMLNSAAAAQYARLGAWRLPGASEARALNQCP